MATYDTKEIKVWDLWVRVGHWSLVTSFVICYFTQEDEYELHLQVGYFLLTLIVIRFLWGFIGTRHARFSDFVRSPPAVIRYLKLFIKKRSPAYVGHNPAGGMMIVLLLLGNLVIALSGIALDGAENRSGPLGGTTIFMYTSYANTVHVWATNITLGFITLHLLGIITTSLMHRENLVRAMITGKKRVKTDETCL